MIPRPVHRITKAPNICKVEYGNKNKDAAVPYFLVLCGHDAKNCEDLGGSCDVKDENFSIIHDKISAPPDAPGSCVVDIVVTAGTSNKVLSAIADLAVRSSSDLQYSGEEIYTLGS